jgi:hypothetical protein
MSASDFEVRVLSRLGESVSKGLAHIDSAANFSLKPKTVPDVAELAINPRQSSEYRIRLKVATTSQC